MKQLIQNFKTGELSVDEVPPPALEAGRVLVENRFSLISAGTEKGTVSVGQASLLGKARMRPDLVQQVLQNVRKEGLRATIDKVRTKLDSLKALGYSTAGVVLASLDSTGRFQPGDRVACAGQDYASHAELVAVPQNLVVKIPDGVSFEEASFTTLGAIALQGVRQADPKLGDTVCVIGLGLLGQLTCQILRANGCNVFGVDVVPELVELAKAHGVHAAFPRDDANLLKALENFSNGQGVDSVIITAGVPTNDPIVLAAEILRRKGVVVVVGAVRMDIPRDPHFYRKELELRMSTSYGPGRYDPEYEENGHDYPYAYVRWTEQRNMAAFLRLVANGAVSVKPLISHVFAIEESVTAYDIVLGKVKERCVGILLRYAEGAGERPGPVATAAPAPADLVAGFIGAGSFAQSYLLPNVRSGGAALAAVVTGTGLSARNVAAKFGFGVAATDPAAVLADPAITTVFVATRHDSHARYVRECLQAGKHVFVEKPLALDEEELAQVSDLYGELSEKSKAPLLMVGFNRRFSPLAVKAREHFQGIGEPLVLQFRVNAGFIPPEHWTQQPAIGGGRIIGEVCHFIDLMQYLTGALPVGVHAACIGTDSARLRAEDNLAVTVRLADGSVGSLVYAAGGDKALAKERLEIFGGSLAFVIDDFREGTLYRNNRAERLRLPGKGHREEVAAFLTAVREGLPAPIPFTSLRATTLATFRIRDSLRTGLPQEVGL